MADDFYLDEDDFVRFTRKLQGVGKTFKGAQRDMSDDLAQYTGAWGTDDIGKAFEGNYWENAEAVRVGTEEAGDGLIETAQGTRKNARYLASIDEDAAAKIDKLPPPE